MENKNKYEEAFSKYETKLNDETVKAELDKMLAEHLEENNTEDVKKLLFNLIDLTTLKCTDSDRSVMEFTKRVNAFDEEHPDMPNVAAICVYPNFAETVRSTLDVDKVNIACVSGGFPASQTFMEIKVAETKLALMGGADEIDMVLSAGRFMDGCYEEVCDEMNELREVCKDHHLKVILETGALKSAENIKKASILAMYCGADFIKTSTGKIGRAHV